MLTFSRTGLLYVAHNTFLFSVLCLVVGNWAPSRNFCVAGPWKYAGPSEQTFHYTEMPDSVVGPRGSVVVWICVTGYFLLFSSAFFAAVCVYAQDEKLHTSYTGAVLAHGLLYSVWAVYGMVLFFGTTIPESCINYDHGNNLAYVALGFLAYYNLVLVPLIIVTAGQVYVSRDS